MTQINDLSERKKANSLGSSYIVKAPAGSGKTTMLVSRLIRALGKVNEPEEVLAITFTRKAAEEMRKRVLSLLSSKDSGKSVDPDLPEIINKIRKKDSEKVWNLTSNPARLSIMTIDSFCSGILKRASSLSESLYYSTVEEDYKSLYTLAARRALSEISSEEHKEFLGRVLSKYDSDWSRVERQLSEMLEQRDTFFMEVGIGLDSEQMEQRFSDFLTSRLLSCDKLFSPCQKQDILTLYNFSEAHLNPNNPNFIRVFPKAKPAAIEVWQHIFERLIFTKTNAVRKNLNALNGFPSEVSETKSMKKLWRKIIDEIISSSNAIYELLQIRTLPNSEKFKHELCDLGDILKLVKLASAHLNLIFAQRQATDFTQQTLDALSALGGLEEPSDLALRLDYSIKHILVDEFQDTSPVQLELIRKLVSGWIQEDGRSLFLVGDPMQSIYRFRKADMDLFNHLFQLGRIESLPLERLTLVNNFRSQKGLIDWINQLFPSALEAAGSSGDFFVPQNAVRKEDCGSPFIFHNITPDDRLAEANHIAELIISLRNEESNLKSGERSSICILGRSKSHLEEIAQTLKKRKIEFTSVELSSLAEIPVIQDLMIVARILLHPADKVAWLAFLRAPWAGFNLEVLSKLSDVPVLRDFLLHPYTADQLSKEDSQRLIWIQDILQKSCQALKTHSLLDSLKMIWVAIGGNSLYRDADSREAVRQFFRLIHGLEKEDGLITFQKISRLTEKSYPDNSQNLQNYLNIMTIHKAKGLEFDIVIIPSAHRTVRSEPQSLLNWENFDFDSSSGGPLVAAYQNDFSNSLYSFLRSFELQKIREEVVRLLYVAVTRARKKVHLLGKLGDCQRDIEKRQFAKPPKGSFLEFIYKRIPTELIQQNSKDSSVELHDNRGVSLKRMEFTERNISRDPFASMVLRNKTGLDALEFEWAGITARQIGIVVHSIFESLDELIRQYSTEEIIQRSLKYAKNRFKSMGVSVSNMNLAVQRTEVGLNNVLCSERGRWLFNENHNHVQRELELFPGAGFSDSKIIIDRTFIDDGVRWIVDYKTGYHDGADADGFIESETLRHKPQLDYYARVLSLEEHREIRLGLYFPLLDRWKEWSYN
mgnify:CR=1 FL=1